MRFVDKILLLCITMIFVSCTATKHRLVISDKQANQKHYQLLSPSARQIKSMVLKSTTWSAEQIDRINNAVIQLERNKLNRSDLLELRVGLSQWRLRGRQHLCKIALATQEPALFQSALESLIALAAVLPQETLSGLANQANRFSKREHTQLLQRLTSLQGDPKKAVVLSTLAIKASATDLMPNFVPEIKASRASDWTTERILSTPALSRYQRDQQGHVIFRGLHLAPGDLLLVNLANPSEGLFTSFTKTTNYASHLALYVELRNGNHLYPCVFESYEHGIRIVPLITYFNPSHTHFVEIYRFRSQPKNATLKLDKAVISALAKPHGFNIHIDEAKSQNGKYITCTTAITRILLQAGFAIPTQSTPIAPFVQSNLERLGIYARQFLTPSDFMHMPQLQVLGWIDNQHWQLKLSSFLAVSLFNQAISTRILEPRHDGAYMIYRFGSKNILQDTFVLGGLLRWFFGFTPDNFPAGPADGLAFVLRVEEEMDAAVLAIAEDFANNADFYLEQNWFSIHATFANTQVKRLVANHFSAIETWFEPNNPAQYSTKRHWPPGWP